MTTPFKRAGLVVAIMLVTAGVMSAPAVASHSATFVVTSTVDATDAAVGDDVCASVAGVCTLRAAVQEANSNPDLNLISLEAPAPATYELTLTGAGEDSGATGDLDVKQDLVVSGRGADVDVLDAGGFDRAFHVQGAGTSFELGDVAVIDGNAGTGDGGAILNAGTTLVHDALLKNNASRNGGGIASVGTLTVQDSRLESNRSSTQAGGIAIGAPATAQPSPLLFSLQDSDVRTNFAESVGGGIVIAVPVPYRYEIVRSSVIGNSANAGGGLWSNAAEDGNYSLIRDTTFAVNGVSDINCQTRAKVCSADAEGGAIVNIGALDLRNVTIVNNTANRGGGGFANGTAAIVGKTRIANSVIANNSNGSVTDNCIHALPTSLGHNLEDTANDCGFDSDPANPDATDGDRTSTEPGLDTQQTEPFGYTSFYPPLETSPVIGAGDNTLCTTEDQLGQPRPAEDNGAGTVLCDVGAIELYERPAQCATFGSLCGTAGDDEIEGTEGDDILVGGPGDDHIVCGGGNDTVYTGEGNDLVECGDGADVIYGDGGNDTIFAGAGDDEIFAGDGNDTIYGDFLEQPDPAVASFTLAPGEGKDKILGQGGNDLAFGGGALDRLFGGLGKDRMWGGQGNDKVKGEDGGDKLYGQNGDDELDGGKGPDQLRAGDGRDLCVFGPQDTLLDSCEKKKRSNKRSN